MVKNGQKLAKYGFVFITKKGLSFAHCGTLIRKKVVKQGHPTALASQLTSSWRPISESNKAEIELCKRERHLLSWKLLYYQTDEKPASRGFVPPNWAETKVLIKSSSPELESPRERPSYREHEGLHMSQSMPKIWWLNTSGIERALKVNLYWQLLSDKLIIANKSTYSADSFLMKRASRRK